MSVCTDTTNEGNGGRGDSRIALTGGYFQGKTFIMSSNMHGIVESRRGEMNTYRRWNV